MPPAVATSAEPAGFAERAVTAERERIARELHDTISHTLSIIALHAATARRQLGGQCEDVIAALDAIGAASHAGLADLRRTVQALRAGSAGPHSHAAGVGDLEALIAWHRAAHGQVELSVHPRVRTAPEELQQNVYRLVQEALTNVRKHALGARAVVDVKTRGRTVIVQVDNDRPVRSPAPVAADRTCYGLTGMRERVATSGGRLIAGPRRDGGFRVRAVLNLHQRVSSAGGSRRT